MKRALVFAIVALLAATAGVAHSAPPPASSALPDFTFKSASAGQVMDPNTVGACTPDGDTPGKLACRGNDRVVAGVKLLVSPSYYFYENRLTEMVFLFENDGSNAGTFDTFMTAFREKYGAPCSTAVEKWQNRAGATFDNATATWCFKTGKLKLKELSARINYGSVIYTDDHKAPTKAVPKDF